MKKLIPIIGFIFAVIFACSEGGVVQTVPPSPAPTSAKLLSPENNIACYESSRIDSKTADVTFSWSASTNTDSYEIKVTNLNTNAVLNKTVNSDKTTMTLSRGQYYAWTIVSKSNASRETAQSEVWRFYLPSDGQSNAAPFPASILRPKPGTSFDKGQTQITLEWEGKDPDGQSLTYEIFLDSKLDAVVNRSVNSIKPTGTTHTLSLSPNTYYWAIKTSDGSASSFTIVYSFKVN